ncbi:MAG: hypothetical protein L0216_03750 [Planctomycetales bacterium]|nr:hypothetical protein [Planctomycetales bacterium]
MGISSANLNNYPRIGDAHPQQKLRRTIAAVDSGKATADDLRAAEDEVTAEVIAEQEAAGLDLVTDGQVRWADPVTHFARGLEGIEVTGLLRYFDTNTYYRQPAARGPVKWKGPVTIRDFQFAAGKAQKPVKAVLPGPATLATLSAAGPYASVEALAGDFARALRDEVAALALAGATWIQLDEPVLARKPGLAPLVAQCLSEVRGGLSGGLTGKARLLLATYFGPADGRLEAWAGLGADGLAVDVAGKGPLGKAPRLPDGLSLTLGVLDGRNTKLEEPKSVAERLRPWAAALRGRDVFLAPNAGLEFLPRDVARAKVACAAEAAKRAAEVIR